MAAAEAVEAMQKERKELECHYDEATKTIVAMQLVHKPGEATLR